ncbi:glucan 1,4-alpha-glucosidase [Spirilliplanes yamanashiensis]|uniref:Glucan 1,4-alpha-glucosidase n=1 Tax=Spirilliplanes yamanashiensis TaxID=42233 RepID=A0A8J4DKJ1_9ACTN|nr:glucan 1,4-alpha-glucosidase [Spirilliplanes yamanashiensis]
MLLAASLLLAPFAVASPAGAAAAPPAPGGPGTVSHFGLARKDCVGTAYGRGSKVWYTVANGVLSDVYSPTVDNTNLESVQFVVTDGVTFTDIQTRDTTYSVRALDESGMSCEVTSVARSGKYRIVAEYLTDPRRDAVVARVRLVTEVPGLQLWVHVDPSVNGNGGGGAANGGADDAQVDAATGALVAADPQTTSSALNRDYAVPTALAVRADRPFLASTSGFAGTASDGLAQLDASRRLTTRYADAFGGNVVQTARLDTGRGPVTLALGFGRDAGSAVEVAGAAARTPFAATAARYHLGWAAYDRTLARPPRDRRRAYYLSANVLKASEDKTFPGAIVASLASPWGQAVSAGDTPGGRPVYFGSYREIFARDLYESFTGLLATGDRATARDTVRWLFERQQLPDGRFPRNSLLNGKVAPDSGGDQLDETAYPVLMAWQAGLAGDRGLWPRVRRAADFLVAYGPSFGSERWEEQSGHSPSTIAAEIAGLVAAARIADRQGARDAARVYRATADHFQRSVKGWTVTTSGPYAPRYFIRLAKTGDPDAAITYNLGNGGPDADQRTVVDAGFLELTRLGVLPPDDPDVLASLPVVDRVLRIGDGFYRYGTATAGTEDGYGDCWEPDPTACAPSGRPWPTGNAGSGHLWPVLSGERAQHHLERGDSPGAARLLDAMTASGTGVGLIPEQTWENPAVPPSAWGTPPEQASIGFVPGGAAGSASPLTWAQSQQVRLIRSLGEGRVIEQPAAVRDRYVTRGAPGTLPVTITAPAEGAVVPGGTATVTGVTAPRARVTVAGTPTDVAGATRTVTVTADAAGAFRAVVPVGFLANVVTVAAERGRATGYARVTVVSEALPGPALLTVDDPQGDDNGPGTYRYPTAADFRPGAYDIERFQVVDAGDTVYLLTRLRDLTPTFGSALGAQLLDVFVRDPAAGSFSTAAPFPQRNYTIAPGSAWSSRIEVQGFAGPVFADAGGDSLGTVTVTANAATRSILVGVPKAALGTPGPGWVFTVALHGQDGYSPDQARGFAATPQPYQFGLCAAGDSAPVCGTDPAAAPKVMDTVVPAGVSQQEVLDPAAPPVQLVGVPVP